MLIFAMRVQHEKFEVRTNGKGTYEITKQVQDEIDKSGARNGVATIFVQHTSCSLTMMENAAPAARRDVERFFEQLVPENADYEHDDEGPDDMPSHIRMVLTHERNRSHCRWKNAARHLAGHFSFRTPARIAPAQSVGDDHRRIIS